MFQLRLCVFGLMAVSASAAALPADEAYLAAQKSSAALKSDPERRKYRHHWQSAAHRFERVAREYPGSSEAPEALLCAAKLLEELSRISQKDEDLRAALADYQQLFDRYPKHPASDASALALGHLYFERGGEPERARRVISAALARHPQGARAEELNALLASLPRPPKATPAKEQVTSNEPPPSRGRASRPTETAAPRTRLLLEAIARASHETAPAPPRRPPTFDPREARDGPPIDAPGVEGRPNASIDRAHGESRKHEGDGLHSASVQSGRLGSSADQPSELAASSASAVSTRSELPKAEGGAPPPPKIASRTPSPKLSEAPDFKRARAPDRRLASSPSSAEQLGSRVRRVVIDPGHGGHDTGAIGARKTREKDIALSISLKLRELLTAEGLEVILTRQGDSFVRLEDRAQLANEAQGDLFVSIHCNSAPTKKLRGIETYTLNTSSDRYSTRLAARENASSERAISDLQYILADLATKANTEQSSRLASSVQQSLIAHVRAKHRAVVDLGTKEALFYVLLGVRMPAILVETSFLSNPEEEQRLLSKGYQGEIAAAIAAGIRQFLGSGQRVAKVD
jgi:N-acetylmuramoyl-L-alanine amidase